jgi:hypothetical protein
MFYDCRYKIAVAVRSLESNPGIKLPFRNHAFFGAKEIFNEP